MFHIIEDPYKISVLVEHSRLSMTGVSQLCRITRHGDELRCHGHKWVRRPGRLEFGAFGFPFLWEREPVTWLFGDDTSTMGYVQKI